MQTFYRIMAYAAIIAAVAFLMYMLVSCASFQSHEDRKKNWTSKDLYESLKMQGVI